MCLKKKFKKEKNILKNCGRKKNVYIYESHLKFSGLHLSSSEYSSILFSTIQFYSVQFNSIQFNSTQFSLIGCITPKKFKFENIHFLNSIFFFLKKIKTELQLQLRLSAGGTAIEWHKKKITHHTLINGL